MKTICADVVPARWRNGRSKQVSLAQLREHTPLGSQERMKRELSALLEELSRVQPVVLFIDDLHWADVSTIDMLNYLAGTSARTCACSCLPATGRRIWRCRSTRFSVFAATCRRAACSRKYRCRFSKSATSSDTWRCNFPAIVSARISRR